MYGTIKWQMLFHVIYLFILFIYFVVFRRCRCWIRVRHATGRCSRRKGSTSTPTGNTPRKILTGFPAGFSRLYFCSSISSTGRTIWARCRRTKIHRNRFIATLERRNVGGFLVKYEVKPFGETICEIVWWNYSVKQSDETTRCQMRPSCENIWWNHLVKQFVELSGEIIWWNRILVNLYSGGTIWWNAHTSSSIAHLTICVMFVIIN